MFLIVRLQLRLEWSSIYVFSARNLLEQPWSGIYFNRVWWYFKTQWFLKYGFWTFEGRNLSSSSFLAGNLVSFYFRSSYFHLATLYELSDALSFWGYLIVKFDHFPEFLTSVRGMRRNCHILRTLFGFSMLDWWVKAYDNDHVRIT